MYINFVFFIAVVIVWLVFEILCKTVNVNNIEKSFNTGKDVKKEGLISILVVLLIQVIDIVFKKLLKSHGVRERLIAAYSFEIHRIILGSLFFIITLVPIILVFIFRKMTLHDLGFTNSNPIKSILKGLGLGTIFTLVYAILSKESFKAVSSINLISLVIVFIMVGINEEVIFRGYLQNKLIKFLGRNRGWLVSSVMFAFSHMPQRIIVQNVSVLNAFQGVILLLPISFLFGYVMMKTRDIYVVIILHAFVNLTTALF